MKYIAIKVKGYSYWLWFEKAKIKRENYKFIGTEGWGKDGALTCITIDTSEIVGEINSDELHT
jgi:hypothetical protein